MDAGWFCWIISLNTTGTRTIFSTRAYTEWYKHSLHIPEMPTIAHLCEFHDLPSWMLGHSAARCCNFEIFQNDLEDFKTIRTCSSFENALGILWHPTTCEVQGPLTPASLDKRPVETGLAVEQPRMAPTTPLIRKTLAEDDTDTTDDTVDSSTSQCLTFQSPVPVCLSMSQFMSVLNEFLWWFFQNKNYACFILGFCFGQVTPRFSTMKRLLLGSLKLGTSEIVTMTIFVTVFNVNLSPLATSFDDSWSAQTVKRFLLSLIFNWFQFVTRPLPVEWSDPSGRRRLKEIEFILFAFNMFSMFSMFRCKMVQKNNVNMWRHVKTFRASTLETMLISLLQSDPRQLHWTSTGPWSVVTKLNQKVYGCLW